MAVRNGQLPAYIIDNAMINFQPLNTGLEGYTKGIKEAGVSTAQINAANAMQAGDFERAASETARSGDVVGGMALRRHPGEMRAQEDAARTRETQMMAGRAQSLLGITDPTERRTRSAEWLNSDPRFAEAAKARGLDINNPDSILQGIVSEARGYRDPGETAHRAAQTNLANSQARLANSQAEQGGKSEALVRYGYYVNQETSSGRTPMSFIDYEKALKTAGATAVTVDTRNENAFAREAGTQQAKILSEIVQSANTSRELVGDLNSLRDLASQFQTGVPADLTRRLGPYADALGIKIDGLSPIQAYQSIIDRMAPRMRVPGSGATSDFDARQFLSSLPQLANTPGGNQVIVNTFQALQDHRLQAGEIAARALSNEISAAEANRLIRALPDPFTAFVQSTGRAPTAPQQGQRPPVQPGQQPAPQQQSRPPQQTQQPNAPADPAAALGAARAAISQGANRSAVEQRLRDAGIDPSGL